MIYHDFSFLGAILEEIGLHQLSHRIPPSIKFNGLIGKTGDHSRDPTLIAPKNYIQAGENNHSYSHSNDQFIRGSNASSMEKIGIPQASRSIYQALKRGLKRLGSLRRNNSA